MGFYVTEATKDWSAKVNQIIRPVLIIAICNANPFTLQMIRIGSKTVRAEDFFFFAFIARCLTDFM
jgi:hypothetical protein